MSAVMGKVNGHNPNLLLSLLFYMAALIVYTGIVAILALAIINIPIELSSVANSIMPYAVLSVELLVTGIGLLCLLRELEKHHAHNPKPSVRDFLRVNFIKNTYIQFVWLGLILSPFMIIALQHLHYINITSVNGVSIHAYPFLSQCLVLALLLATLYVAGGVQLNELERLRFSPGSTDKDELGYKHVAKQDMISIINTNKHVVVAVVNGRLGEGKSSYLRMMVGSRPPDEFLYTYISLTETNEVKSFSKLFAERWSETIAKRYPSASHSAKQSILDNIFRESSNGVFKTIRTVIHNSRWPLRRTRLHADGDTHLSQPYANEIIAPMFGYVPCFYEKYWVVVIDEVERSRFDEIYRVVETLERFRMEAQWGLPVKLIFVLCIDRIRFRQRAEEIRGDNEAASLSHSFLEREPKTVDVHIDLPPVSPDKKQAYITRREKEWLIDKYQLNTDRLTNPDTNEKGYLKIYWSQSGISYSDVTSNGGVLDDKKAHDWMMYYLMAESPRSITKILEQTDYFLSRFARSVGRRDPNQIRLSDLIMLNYLKFKHPVALRFLIKVHPLVFPDFHDQGGGQMELFFRQLRNKTKTDKTTFEAFFRSHVDADTRDKITSEEINEVEGIVAYICSPIMTYLDALDKEHSDSDLRYESDDKPKYDNTLAMPENLWDALTIATDQNYVRSDYFEAQDHAGYIHHNQKLPSDLYDNSEELVKFARDLRRYYPMDYVSSQYVADRLADMLIDETIIERHPGTLIRNSTYNDATYRFGFHVANYVARDEADGEMVERAFNLLKKVLTASTVMLETKIHIIHMFFVFSRSNNSENAFDFDRARKKFEARYMGEIKKMVSDVIEHGLDKYLPETGDSIYDHEENYFYAMYQLWSGDPNDKKGIGKLRRVASYKLAEHPEVVEAYWQNRFRGNDSWVENAELYLDIEDLIKITKQAGLTEKFQDSITYWRRNMNQKKESLVAVALKEGFSTVRYQLAHFGYLSNSGEQGSSDDKNKP